MIGVFAMVSSLVQLITTNEMRGRVVSVYNCAFRGGMPMGNLVSGFASNFVSVPVVLAINGGLVSLAGLYFLLQNRQVREL